MSVQRATQNSSSTDHIAYGRVRLQCDNTTRIRENDKRTYLFDIKPRLPKFAGEPDTWEPFLMQLQLMSRSYGWSDPKFRDQLMFGLRGEALSFASLLPCHARENTKRLLSAMVQRFGKCRATLNDIKKLAAEMIQLYSAWVSQLMSRAYLKFTMNYSFSNSLSWAHVKRTSW